MNCFQFGVCDFQWICDHLKETRRGGRVELEEGRGRAP